MSDPEVPFLVAGGNAAWVPDDRPYVAKTFVRSKYLDNQRRTKQRSGRPAHRPPVNRVGERFGCFLVTTEDRSQGNWPELRVTILCDCGAIEIRQYESIRRIKPPICQHGARR